MRHVQGRARRTGVAPAAVLTWAALLAECSFGGSGTLGLDGAPGKPPAPEDVIHITPDDDSKAVRPGRPLLVEVPDGRLQKVTVVRSQGAQQGPGVCPARPTLGRLTSVGSPGSRRTRPLWI
ncbi:hypothetical protein ACIBJF_42975, partial [Streptomyces sp. NPDC050743]